MICRQCHTPMKKAFDFAEVVTIPGPRKGRRREYFTMMRCPKCKYQNWTWRNPKEKGGRTHATAKG